MGWGEGADEGPVGPSGNSGGSGSPGDFSGDEFTGITGQDRTGIGFDDSDIGPGGFGAVGAPSEGSGITGYLDQLQRALMDAASYTSTSITDFGRSIANFARDPMGTISRAVSDMINEITASYSIAEDRKTYEESLKEAVKLGALTKEQAAQQLMDVMAEDPSTYGKNILGMNVYGVPEALGKVIASMAVAPATAGMSYALTQNPALASLAAKAGLTAMAKAPSPTAELEARNELQDALARVGIEVSDEEIGQMIGGYFGTGTLSSPAPGGEFGYEPAEPFSSTPTEQGAVDLSIAEDTDRQTFSTETSQTAQSLSGLGGAVRSEGVDEFDVKKQMEDLRSTLQQEARNSLPFYAREEEIPDNYSALFNP